MTDLKHRTDALAGETGSAVEAVADKVCDEVEVPVVELHQLGRRARDKGKTAEPTAADHLKLVE
jgi:hypothetical protein